MTPPLARYHNWLASDGGAWITDSPRLLLRLALPGAQTRLAARVAEPPRPPPGSHYPRLVISPNAPSARSTASASVSLWVTQRIEIGPVEMDFNLPAAREAPDAEPAAAPSPFDRQKVTESACGAKSLAGRRSATAALKMRAPSRWTGTPASCAPAATAPISSGVQHVPPWRLCVFSMQTSPVGGVWMLAGRSASRTCSGVRNPRAVFTGRVCTPPMTAAPATS